MSSTAKDMKKLLFCGLCRQKTASSPILSTMSIESRAISKTNMATTNTDQIQYYTATCGPHTYTVPVRYQELRPIGQGAYGVVVRAKDTVTGKHVAIKKMLQPFQSPTSATRTYRELKLLMHLNHPDAQVIQLYNVFTPDRNVNDFQTLYFVFNYSGQDLDRVIRHQSSFSEEHIKLIIYSLLRGLKFIHSAGIIHRDLKPTNIGINHDSDITILDFGLARVLSNGIQTGYVSTRWWRAPEVYINWERYDDKLDIWSTGCIMAELILRTPVFGLPYDPKQFSHIDQLNKIFDIIGTPDLTTLDEICTPEAAAFISQMPPRPKQDFNELFGFKYDPETQAVTSGVSPQGIDFLERLLSFDHRLRPTAEQALADPFLATLHDPTDEPSIEPMFDEHQDAVYSIAQWKSIVWQLIEDFLPPSWVNDGLVDDS